MSKQWLSGDDQICSEDEFSETESNLSSASDTTQYSTEQSSDSELKPPCAKRSVSTQYGDSEQLPQSKSSPHPLVPQLCRDDLVLGGKPSQLHHHPETEQQWMHTQDASPDVTPYSTPENDGFSLWYLHPSKHPGYYTWKSSR